LSELWSEREQMKEGKDSQSKQRINNQWGRILSSERDETLSEGANFKIPKIHLIKHFVPLISLFSTLSQ
jgi:hypothetical protein